ncbi:MAG: hypothetical protein CMN55_13200 [Sneathiella sp.]|jgi:hypothetical protein|uniref:hypothetical protein n=1 Tax=Sneathiella sp. TaxID=1964365 RepID=UPI000C504E53|nr:hypothetical protein [Sneathiella sp.]MAL80046.1 hypothetical protein [Sneathiella sp.]|tara:strand:+ start:126 stop:896 length:771 start_codon:yes stop_codon:yes gene_type:complete
MDHLRKWFARPLDEGVTAFGWLALIVGGGLALSFFVPWIWSEVDGNEGKGAFLGALIGFSGLIYVAHITGRQNSNALVEQAEIDRKNKEVAEAEKKEQQLAYVIGAIKITYAEEKILIGRLTHAYGLILKGEALPLSLLADALDNENFGHIHLSDYKLLFGLDSKIIQLALHTALVFSEQKTTMSKYRENIEFDRLVFRNFLENTLISVQSLYLLLKEIAGVQDDSEFLNDTLNEIEESARTIQLMLQKYQPPPTH